MYGTNTLLIWADKKLSTNSSWNFEHIVDTLDDYWVGPDEKFFPAVLQPVGSTIIFPKSGRIQNLTPMQLKKTFFCTDAYISNL